MQYREEDINWNTPAGKQLELLTRRLPADPPLDLTVFGSAPLQLVLDPGFLSADIDLFGSEETWDFLTEFVEHAGMGQGKADYYIQVCDPKALRSTHDC